MGSPCSWPSPPRRSPSGRPGRTSNGPALNASGFLRSQAKKNEEQRIILLEKAEMFEHWLKKKHEVTFISSLVTYFSFMVRKMIEEHRKFGVLGGEVS